MSEFSGSNDFDLRRVLTEVDFKTRRRADSTPSYADPDEDSLGAQSLLGQFTATATPTTDTPPQETDAAQTDVASPSQEPAGDLDAGEIGWRETPLTGPAGPDDPDRSRTDLTARHPVPAGTVEPDADAHPGLGSSDAPDPATVSSESARHHSARRPSPSSRRPAVAPPGYTRFARLAALAALGLVAAAVVAAAIHGLDAGTGTRPGVDGAIAGVRTAFEPTAALGGRLGRVPSDLEAIARAVPEARRVRHARKRVTSRHSVKTATVRHTSTAPAAAPESQTYTQPTIVSPTTTARPTTTVAHHTAASKGGKSTGATTSNPLGGIGSCVKGCS